MTSASEPMESEPLEPKQQSLARSSALMASGTLVSRMLGFVRTAMLVAAIGSVAGVISAFEVANTLPTMVYNLIAAGVLDAVLVPQIVKALKTRSGSAYVSKLLTAVGSLLFVLTLLAMVATPLLISLFAPKLTLDQRELAITFALFCVPQIFFYGLYNLFGEVLNARGVFGPYMWAPVVNNLISIASLAAFISIWGVSGQMSSIEDFTMDKTIVLCGFATLGIVCQALVLIFPVKKSGVKLSLDFKLRGTSFGSVPKVAMWTFATLMVSQLGVWSTSNLATRADGWSETTKIATAGIKAYNNGFMLFMVPQGLITVTIVTAIFTRLASHAAQRDMDAVAGHFYRGVQLVVMLCMVFVAILMVTASPMSQMTMPTLGSENAALFGAVLVALAMGLPSTGITMMSQRVFFALEDAKPVFLMGIIPTIAQLIVGWAIYFAMDAHWWTIGAAIGETTARVIQGFIAFWMVSRIVPQVDFKRLVGMYGKYFVGFVVSGLVGWGVMHLLGPAPLDSSSIGTRFVGAGLRVAIVSLFILAVYFGVLRFTDPAGFQTIVTQVKRRLGRGFAAATASDQTDAADAESAVLDQDEDRLLTEEANALATRGLALPGSIEVSEALAGERDSGDFSSSETNRQWSDTAPSWDQIFEGESPAVVFGRSGAAHDPSATGSLPILTDAMLAMASAPSESDLARWLNEELDDPGPAHGNWKSLPKPPVESSSEIESSSPVEGGDSDIVAGAITAAAVAAAAELSQFPEHEPPGVPGVPGPAADSFDGGVPAAKEPEVGPVSDGQDDSAGRLEQMRTAPSSVPVVVHSPAVLPPPPAPRRTVAGMSSSPSGAPLDPEAMVAGLGTTNRKGKPRGRFNPTIPTLIIGLLVVGGGLYYSANHLFPPSADLPSSGAIQSSQSEQSKAPVTPADPNAGLAKVVPTIVGTTVLSWDNDDGDHPELATALIDSDPATVWRSRYFETPGGYESSAPIMLVFNLQETAIVHQININAIATGGKVTVVDTSGPDPRAGAVLGTGSFNGGDTKIVVEKPTPVSSIGLIINSLPVDDEGRNRAKIAYVSVE